MFSQLTTTISNLLDDVDDSTSSKIKSINSNKSNNNNSKNQAPKIRSNSSNNIKEEDSNIHINIDNNKSSTYNASSINSDDYEITSLKNEINEKQLEINSLQQVWNETRAKLTKLQEFISDQDETHKQNISNIESKFAIERIQLQSENKKERDEWRNHMKSKETGIQQALNMNDKMVSDLQKEIVDLQLEVSASKASYETSLNELRHLQITYDDLKIQNQREVESLTKNIIALRDEITLRESSFEEERSVWHKREIPTDYDHTSAIVQSNKELVEKSNALTSLQNRFRWLQTDKDNLQSELNAEKASRKEEKEEMKRKTEELINKVNDHFRQIREKEDTIADLKLREQKLITLNENRVVEPSPTEIVNDLERKLASMSNYLLEKQLLVERLISEKATIKLWYEHEQKKVANLNAEIKTLREQDGDDLEANLPMSSNLAPRVTTRSSKAGFKPMPPLKAPQSVQNAVTVIDSIGNQLVIMLRKFPYVRIAFICYIVILHIWVAMVFFHFLHHSDVAPTSSNIKGPNKKL